MHPRTRRAAGWWLVATLVAIFPANVWMAQHPERYRVPGGRAALLARLPLQAAFVAWVRAGGAALAEDLAQRPPVALGRAPHDLRPARRDDRVPPRAVDRLVGVRVDRGDHPVDLGLRAAARGWGSST